MPNPNVLTDESISKIASAVFAQVPHARVSERYTFVPTSHVVDLLKDEGWEPVKAVQTRIRDVSRSGYQRHMLRFRHGTEKAARIGDSIPELVLVNAHDGTAAYQLHAGLYRLVCSNGLCVADSIFAKISVRHVGFKAEDIISASYRVLDEIPRITTAVEGMRSVTLTEDESLNFAEAALRLKYPEQAPIEARQLLIPRRFEDRAPTLWNVFNRTQEALLAGGIAGRSTTGRRMRTRGIQSIGENLRLNKSLWELAEQTKLAKLGAAGLAEAA
jgi:hypothetical protein